MGCAGPRCRPAPAWLEHKALAAPEEHVLLREVGAFDGNARRPTDVAALSVPEVGRPDGAARVFKASSRCS